MTTQINPTQQPVTANVVGGEVVKVQGHSSEAVKAVAPPAKTKEKSVEQERSFVGNKYQIVGRDERLSIKKDKDSGRFVYLAINRETGEIVRQLPRDALLKALSSIRDPEGLLVDKKV